MRAVKSIISVFFSTNKAYVETPDHAHAIVVRFCNAAPNSSAVASRPQHNSLQCCSCKGLV
jgi:hypothetical protein